MKIISLMVGFAVVAVFSTHIVASDSERDRICHSGFSKTLRLPQEQYYRVRDTAFHLANVPIEQQCHRGDTISNCYVLDHITPLSLDPPNPNSQNNLQVQTYLDSMAKDRVEKMVTKWYCMGMISQEKAWSYFARSVP